MTMRRLGWSGWFLLAAALGACSVFGSDDPPGSPAPESDAGPDVGALKEPRGLEVTVPAIVAMEGQTTAVDVTILRRGGLDAEVTLEVVGSIPEVTAKPTVVPRGQTAAKLEFDVKATTKHGPRVGFSIRARSEEIETLAGLEFSVRGKSGAMDTGFGADGRSGGLFAGLARADSLSSTRIGLLADGKVVVGASTVSGGTGTEQFSVARLDTAGVLDKLFGAGGRTRFGAAPTFFGGMAVQGDGKVVLCGHRGNSNEVGVVARLTADGNPDFSFGSSSAEMTYKHSSYERARFADCSMVANGNIAVAGSVLMASSGAVAALLSQVSTSGQLVNGWGNPPGIKLHGAGKPVAWQVMVRPDGRYVASFLGANFGAGAGADLLGLAANGVDLDPSVGTSGNLHFPKTVSVSGLLRFVALSDGGFIVGGTRSSNGLSYEGCTLIRFRADWSVDTSFGVDGVIDIPPPLPDGTTSHFLDVAEQKDGKILVVSAHQASGQPVGSIVHRFTANGAPDTSFANGGRAEFAVTHLKSLVLEEGGRIVIAGAAAGDYVVLRLWN